MAEEQKLERYCTRCRRTKPVAEFTRDYKVWAKCIVCYTKFKAWEEKRKPIIRRPVGRPKGSKAKPKPIVPTVDWNRLQGFIMDRYNTHSDHYECDDMLEWVRDGIKKQNPRLTI